MWDFYEQPWTLLGIAIISLFIVFTYRSVCDDKRHWWQFLIPILIAAAGFGMDHLVETDNENIESVLEASIAALEAENYNRIESYISDDYRDSYHSSKERLLDHARQAIRTNMVKEYKKTNTLVKFAGNRATVNLFMHIIMGEGSPAKDMYNVPFFQLKVDVDFTKENKKWLISSIEIRSVNKQPVRWNDI